MLADSAKRYWSKTGSLTVICNLLCVALASEVVDGTGLAMYC